MGLLTTVIPLHIHARMTGRAWWTMRYTNGRIIDEREVDWSMAPYRNRQALRLVCPSGRVAELGNTKNAEGRFLQFKIAFSDVAMSGPGGGKSVTAQVIGILKDTSGTVQCWAWETVPGRLVGPFLDNWFDFKYGGVGPLSANVLGVVPD